MAGNMVKCPAPSSISRALFAIPPAEFPARIARARRVNAGLTISPHSSSNPRPFPTESAEDSPMRVGAPSCCRLCSAGLAMALPASGRTTACFIIANNPDGYGVDRCLATGAPCGARSRPLIASRSEFQTALSFRKVDASDITGACSGR